MVGKVAQLLERELTIYLAHTGREGTFDGFREHCRKLVKANLALLEMLFEEYVDAFIEAEPWGFDPE